MVTSDHILLTSGVILTVLISAMIISYTTKLISTFDNPKKPTIQTYDPDLDLNSSRICILSPHPHSTRYADSPCSNKTLLLWYNPWLRHHLWAAFWAETNAREAPGPTEKPEATTAQATEAPTPPGTTATAPPEAKRKARAEALRGKPAEFVYSVLVGLLVVSGLVACWEVCKEKLKRNEAAAAKAQERECSLADFTIKRHLRRESQLQQTGSHLPRQASLELTAKVTQTLVHQSSLDRAFPKKTSEALSSAEVRRNSVPLNLSDNQSASGGKCGKRQSMDVSVEEMSLDLKRKPRHFIRRH